MKSVLTINFFLLAKSPRAKEKVLNNIKSHLHECLMGLSCRSIGSEVELCGCFDCWEQATYAFLKICQRIGNQWILTGNIDFEFNAWTNNPTLMGVESIGAVADNPAYKNS